MPAKAGAKIAIRVPLIYLAVNKDGKIEPDQVDMLNEAQILARHHQYKGGFDHIRTEAKKAHDSHTIAQVVLKCGRAAFTQSFEWDGARYSELQAKRAQSSLQLLPWTEVLKILIEEPAALS